jgi:hypothetical protein
MPKKKKTHAKKPSESKAKVEKSKAKVKKPNASKAKVKKPKAKEKKERNKKNNVLVEKIMPRAKEIYKKGGINMTEAVKQASADYRAGKL